MKWLQAGKGDTPLVGLIDLDQMLKVTEGNEFRQLRKDSGSSGLGIIPYPIPRFSRFSLHLKLHKL
jgi:hypothetical protein